MANSDLPQASLRQLAESRYPPLAIGASGFLLVAVIWAAVLTRIDTEHELTTSAIHTQNTNLAQTYDAAVSASLRRADDLLQLVAERGIAAAAERLRPTAELAALIPYMALLGPDGAVLESTAHDGPANLGDAAFLDSLNRADPRARVFAKPYSAGSDERLLFVLARVVADPQGRELRVAAALDPRYYYDLFDRASLGRDGVVALTGLDGIVRARAGDPKAIAGQNIAGSVLFERLQSRPQGHYLAHSRYDHVARLFSYRLLADYPLVITVGVSEEAAYADWRKRRGHYFLGAVLATLLIAAATAGWIYLVLLQRRWARELEAGAGNYRRIFEDNPLPMWVFDQATRAFLTVNQAAIAHYGYSREEFLALTIDQIRPPEDIPRLTEYLDSQRSGRGSAGIWHHRKKGGELITVRLTRDEIVFEGRTARLIVAEDITEQLRADERLKLALESSHTAIWEWDLLADRVYLSDQVYDLLERPQGSIDLSQGVLPLVAPEDHGSLKSAIEGVLHSPDEHPEMEGELQVLTGGGKRWVQFRGRLYHDGAGRPARILGVVVDISQRKRVELELKRSEERFRHVFQTINVGYAQTDFDDGTMRLVNPGLVRLLGAKSERELLGRSSREFFVDPQDRENFKATLLRNDQVDNFPVILKRVDGTPVHVLLSDFLVRDAAGEPALVEGVLIDVSPLKQAELAVRKSKEALQAILDATLESLIMVDPEGRVLALNTTAARRLGGTPVALLGARLADRYPADIAAQRRAWVTEVLQSGRALIGEDERGARIYSTHHYPVRDEAGVVHAVVLFSLDVTERRHSEALLAESEARLRALVTALPDLVFTTDGEGRLVEWLSGQAPDGAKTQLHAGREITAALHVAEDRGVIAAIRSCAHYGETATREFSLAANAGETWFEMRATRVQTKPGTSPTVVCVARNITARRDTEAQMAAARTRLLTTLESMVVGVLEVGGDGRVRYANGAACEILEAPVEDIVGQHFRHDLGRRWRQIDAEGQPVPPEELSLAVTIDQGRPVRQADAGIRDAEGRVKWLNLNSMPIIDGEGRVTGAVVNFEDVTEARRAFRALRESNRLNRQIVSSAREGIVVVDQDLRYIVWNPAMEEMTGASAEAVLGRHIDEGLHFPGKDLVTAAYRRALAGETVTLPDMHFDYAETGRSGWAAGQHGPLRDSEGRIIGVIAMVSDITERKAREQEVEGLNATLEQRVKDRTAELEAVNRELESFSYSVSHDLRAPLRSIDGFSELLLAQHAGQLDETGRRFLQRVRANTRHMATLIDQLLELARVSRAEVHRRRTDLSALAKTITQALQAQYPARVVDWRISDGLEGNADQQLLRIVLENLLGNALKFTAGKSPAIIEVGVGGDQNGDYLYVRDNGAGFDMAYATKLFGAFQRLHRPEEFPGTGVGLASVKRIITMHGGRVWADASPGAGATFFFTLG
ncbi:MAG: PAS domain S-box protein [Betaproteobacteria bacterium]|nr:PAS domain S-box protein [Betaproteobacteria bacterium]